MTGAPARTTREARQEADRLGDLAGELIARFNGKASVDQMRVCYRAASQAVDLDRLLPLLRRAWESGDEDGFAGPAREYLRLSAQLFDALHELGGVDGRFTGCDVELKSGLHLAVSDSVLLRLCRLEAEAAA